jgi:hypothetical protein
MIFKGWGRYLKCKVSEKLTLKNISGAEDLFKSNMPWYNKGAPGKRRAGSVSVGVDAGCAVC